ncbi:hypothetical protein Gotur_032192, partial [Gossypium turneri]
MSSSSLPKEGNRGQMKMEGIEGDATLRKEFSSDVESTIAAVRALSATTVSTGQADLTNLFRLAA